MRAVLILLTMLALAGPAHAARSVPQGFYGMTYDGDVIDAPADAQADAWGRMAANGVESARAVFSWLRAQTYEGHPFNFDETDRVVRDAAEHGVDLLPIVMYTPYWARPRVDAWYPKDPETLRPYMRALVERYGPAGTFWNENPLVPRRPLRHWQIYNEPGRSSHYPPVLRVGYEAVKQADPGAKVVVAGFTGTARGTPWAALASQYRNGDIGRYFDIGALNLYTGKPENVVEGARLFRRVMKRHADGRKPLWMTEFGITASRGRTDVPRWQTTLSTTDRGMATFLSDAYRLLARNRARRDIRLSRAYWYTWASSYRRGAPIFRFAGLFRYDDGRFDAKPALTSYRRSARRDEGCAKTTAGVCR